jgi:AbrB family looped-hinge helix DNA binding protein
MAAHRLTSKGQVTIPKAMRDAIGLRPGDVIEFEHDGERLFISRAEYERPEDHPMIQRLRAAGKHMTMSSAELMALLRDPEDEALL